MRIGFFHDGAGSRHAGGIAVYTRRIADALADRCDVTVYTQAGDRSAALADSGVNVVETPRLDGPRSAAMARALPVGKQELAKFGMVAWTARHDVIDHIDEHVDLLFTFQAIDDVLLSNLVDVPTVRGFHSEFAPGLVSAVRERWTRTELHVANSPYLAGRVAETFGYEVDAVIPPGVDTDRFHPDADSAFESDLPTVLFVGRLVESKGIFDLLVAVSRLDERVRLVVVGNDNVRSVRDRCARLGIADDVRIEGVVPHPELPRYYAGADVFCLPSHAESFGMVNLEAMACGTPVVTTDLEGIEAVVRPGTDGVVVPPGDRNALERALEDLLEDPDRRESMGARARSRSREFTWDRQAERMERFCADVLAATDVRAN